MRKLNLRELRDDVRRARSDLCLFFKSHSSRTSSQRGTISGLFSREPRSLEETTGIPHRQTLDFLLCGFGIIAMSAPTFATDSDARELSQGLHVRVVSEPQEHNGNSKAPVRKELTGLNQRWCWDISCLLTFQKSEYL